MPRTLWSRDVGPTFLEQNSYGSHPVVLALALQLCGRLHTRRVSLHAIGITLSNFVHDAAEQPGQRRETIGSVEPGGRERHV